MSDLGALEKTIRPTAMGTWNYFGAAILAFVGGAFLIHYGFTAHHGLHLKSVVGGGLSIVLGGWMVMEFNRLRRLSFALHAGGMSSSEGTRFSWSDVVAIETRYVPGMRKKGIADDGNLAAAYVLSRGQQPMMFPRELGVQNLHDLIKLISARSGAQISRVLIANLTQR